MAPLIKRVQSRLREGHRFFARRIWEARLDELPAGRARWYRFARIAQRTALSLVLEDALHVRAAALTYFTVLSLVPLLAFVFALLKGFGAYDALVDQTIRPYVLRLLTGNDALRDAFEQILGFVGQTGVTRLGFLGLLTLFYAATRLLRNIEVALNELWNVGAGRGPLDQLRDYTAIIVVTPLCLVAAAGLTTASQALPLLKAAGETLGVSTLLSSMMSMLAPLVVLFLGLLVLYKVMPYTAVHAGSAALGAIVGSLAWYGVLVAHVRFQLGVARFNVLYSSFAALPIFLAWLQLSWMTVLLGAQVAAIHQNNRRLAQRKRGREDEPMHREVAALAATLRIARCFAACQPGPSLESLSDELDIPVSALEPMLQRIAQAGIVTKACEGPLRYVLAKPLAAVRAKDVLDALRTPTDPTRSAPFRNVACALELWQQLDGAAADSPANITLAALVQADRVPGPCSTAPSPNRLTEQG